MAILALKSGDGKTATLIAETGETLARAIWLSGLLPPRSMCAGLALCGKCKLKYLSEAPEPTEKDRRFFSDSELGQGWRFGCQHTVPPNEPLEETFLHVEIPQKFVFETEYAEKISSGCAQEIYIGFDLGTTTIEWRAFGNEGTMAEGHFPNPQGAAGADIISRLEYARTPEHKSLLSGVLRNAILGEIQKLRSNNYSVLRICLAANSAMTEILLEKDIEGLCKAPARLAYTGAEFCPFPADKPVTEAIFPPLAGPFTGSDTSCGILALEENNTPKPFLLADLGTNAELALLAENNDLFLASVPLGPALEGIGPRCGQEAGPGVCSGFNLGLDGLVPVCLPGASPKMGICATGYLSLIGLLRNLQILDSSGKFNLKPANPLAAKIVGNFAEMHNETILRLADGLFLAASDVEQLLKVRAALYVGIRQILKKARLLPSQIASWRIAGALGSNAFQKDLEILGLPPNLPGDKVKAIGNVALEGACILAKEPEKLFYLKELCDKATILDLTAEPEFQKNFLNAMQLP